MSELNIEGKINRHGFCIKKSSYTTEILNEIKSKFIAKPKTDEDDEKDLEKKKFYVFYEDDTFLVLPKFCYKLKFDFNKKIKYKDNNYKKFKFTITKISYSNQKRKFKTKRKPYDYQQIILDFLDEHFKKCDENNVPKGGILKLDCGAGKTVLASIIAAKLKVKTLIVVPQNPIMEQWIEEFKEFSTAKVGIIQGKKIEIEDKDIVIAMVHSLSLKSYDPSVFKDFGLVIYDEVHHLGAKKFSLCLQKTSFEYTIGLSATPERVDGTMFVINWSVGDILYSMQRELNYRIWIKKINYMSTDMAFKEKKRWFKGRMAFDTQGTLKKMLSIPSRINLVCSVILKLILLDRKILILSNSIEHLSKLCSTVDEELSKLKNKNKDVAEKDYKTHVYIGSTKKNVRENIRINGDIIFATIQLVEEGFNIKRLDTIVFASPVSIPTQKQTKEVKSTKKLVQSIGRILRKNELDDISQVPLVIDFCDELSAFKTWTKKRQTFYDQKKWFVQNYDFKDNKLISIQEDSDKIESDKSVSSNISNTSKNFLMNDNFIFKELKDENFIHNKLIIKKKELDNEFEFDGVNDDMYVDKIKENKTFEDAFKI